MDGTAVSLEAYLDRPMTPPDPASLAAVAAGEAEPAGLLGLDEMDRLLDPAPLAVETGWWRLPDGTQQVAARTRFPDVTGEMIDWWFDWHPHEAIRYRIWYPAAHRDNRVEAPEVRGAKPFWGTVHHPVEDVGTGMVRARIAFLPPSAYGFMSDALEDPNVATIAGGYVGDDTRRTWHSVMTHVFLREGDGLVLRSRFWMGARIVPMLPGPLARPVGRFASRPAMRRRALPHDLAPGLARHCLEEYANLAALLPELYAAYGD
ncbi:MAG: DAPG hydrolase family protein [Baekduiaceae bacterium]